MRNLKRLISFLKPYRRILLTASLFLTIASVTNLVIPLQVKQLVDVVMVEKSSTRLNEISLGIGLFLLIQMIFSALNRYLFYYTEKRVATDLRKEIFRHLQTLSISFYVKRRTGEIISRLTNDVTALENVITDLPSTALQQSIRLIGGIGIITYMNWKLTFLILLLSPVIVFFARTFGRKLKRLSTEIQDKLATSTTILEENISCIQIVKSFVREKLECERFSNAVEDSFKAAKKRILISCFFGPTIGFMAFGTALTLLWYGGREVITGSISPGELIAFILYATIIAGPMGSFARMFTRLQECLGASERIFEILDIKPDVHEKADAPPIGPIQGRVEMSNLEFQYKSDQKVLRGISFVAQPGEMIALVGHSGAGKSTLVQLLHRFYDPTQGEIQVDGTPIKNITLSSYWSQIGLVPQETILFGGTIEENIRYAKANATPEEVIAAAKSANAHQFIMECPEKYKTVVGEKGIRLSAGQRQRIAIARVILKNPRILILDEATSALDNESEKLIQDALERLMRGITSFVVAHRLSTIYNADKIIVLEHGCIVETGTHAELIEKRGIYHYLHNVKSLKNLDIVETEERASPDLGH